MRGVKIETKRFTIWAAVVIGAGAAMLTLSTEAQAQSDEAAFYKGKSIELVVGSSAGGGSISGIVAALNRVLELTPEGVHQYGGGYTEYVARTGHEAPGLRS